MSLKIGINGFGRMGRLALRVAWEDNEWGYANRTIELVRLAGLADH